MSEQFVLLPADVLGGSQKYDAISLLATATRYSLPDHFQGNQLERDLELRFSSLPAIGLSDATAWLSTAGVRMQTLSDQVSVIASGDTETLHVALQQGNDDKNVQLLAVSDASKLIELEDTGEIDLTSRPLSSRSVPCLLLRLGYSTDKPYAYYSASLPGDSHRIIKVTWQSVIAAVITAAVAILPPKAPLDIEALKEALHIQEQAMLAQHQAHANVLSLLGLPAATAPAIPAIVPQTV